MEIKANHTRNRKELLNSFKGKQRNTSKVTKRNSWHTIMTLTRLIGISLDPHTTTVQGVEPIIRIRM